MGVSKHLFIDENTVYISGKILDCTHYHDLLVLLENAESSKILTIIINSTGGDVNTALQIANAVKSSKAEVWGVIDVQASSAASFIFFACDKRYVADNAYMLLHNCTASHGGKHGQVVSKANFLKDWFMNIIQTYYKDFLTKEEILLILSDSDVWLNADQIKKRLVKLSKSTKNG